MWVACKQLYGTIVETDSTPKITWVKEQACILSASLQFMACEYFIPVSVLVQGISKLRG